MDSYDQKTGFADAFPSTKFADLSTHEALRAIPATGTLAHTAHPTPTFAAANVDCDAGTSTDPGDPSDGEDFALQHSHFIKRDLGRSSPDAVVLVVIIGNHPQHIYDENRA
jgi:hypothetical protein